MSDSDTGGNSPRDNAGQFVKRAAETAQELHTPDNEGVHPMAKILFGWTEMKGMGAIIFWVTALAAVALIGADVYVNRHDYFNFANATGFYGIWGFASFAFVVLMGWPLGKLLRRDEDYYGDAGGPPDDIDPDIGGRG